MELEQYYGEYLSRLRLAEQSLIDFIEACPCAAAANDTQPVLYCKSRIKSPESTRDKLRSKGLPTDAHTALTELHDAIGIRIICSFISNVYEIADWLKMQDAFAVLEQKDYISYPKPNGYRSLHLILRFAQGELEGLMAEVQIRTIAIDFWAALEHQLKYKRDIPQEKTIQQELKRCADEIASVDMSMQTIRDILQD